jgi:hypothetical protein
LIIERARAIDNRDLASWWPPSTTTRAARACELWGTSSLLASSSTTSSLPCKVKTKEFKQHNMKVNECYLHHIITEENKDELHFLTCIKQRLEQQMKTDWLFSNKHREEYSFQVKKNCH